MPNTASDKQINFINVLKAERDLEVPEAQQALTMGQQLWRLEAFDTKAASLLISTLKTLPKIGMAKPVAAVTPVEAPEGMHRLDGAIYKVQRAIHGSGHLYAKVLVIDEPGTNGRFEHAPGVIRRLSEATKMTLDQAKEFGALYGTCCVCGRTLTDETSIEAGIGPVCGKRFA